MTQPTPKECLKKIASSFQKEMDTLSNALVFTELATMHDSFGTESQDVFQLREREKTINKLFDNWIKQPLQKIPEKRTYGDTPESRLLARIDQLEDKDVNSMLKEIETDSKKLMEPEQKNQTEPSAQSSLKTHYMNDKWIFPFLAKIMKFISEQAGLKTTSETLLEDVHSLAKNNK